MIANCFCLFLLACGLERIQADHSILTRSPLEDTTYHRSVITDSKLGKCRLDLASMLDSTAKGSVLVYSIIGNSTITESVLNATYSDHRLDGKSAAEVFRNAEPYHFNRIFDSEIFKARIDGSPNCRTDKPGYNSSVYHSRVLDSTIRHTQVVRSSLTDSTNSCLSVISFSDLCRTIIANSITRKSKATSCILTNAISDNAVCEGSKVVNGELISSTVINSTFANSHLKKDSQATNATVKNSVISGQSKVFGSTIINSNVVNSKLKNCIVINSSVKDKTWDSIKIVNNMIIHNRGPGHISWLF